MGNPIYLIHDKAAVDITVSKSVSGGLSERRSTMQFKTLDEFNREFFTVPTRPGGSSIQARREAGKPAVESEIAMPAAQREAVMSAQQSECTRTVEKKPKARTPDAAQTKARTPDAARPRKAKTSSFISTSSIMLYLVVLVFLFAAITSQNHSFFNVTTSSMHDEIPKGSMILVRRTDPQSLEVGDNITFMREWDTSVTHKIVHIYEDFPISGARGFQTKGNNNANPDSLVVREENLIGKVVFTLPGIGTAVSLLAENIYIVYTIFVLFLALTITLRVKRIRTNKTGPKGRNSIAERNETT